eukprot:scaffold30605_cov32-Prasinocladus_malaysianus.AAC.1
MHYVRVARYGLKLKGAFASSSAIGRGVVALSENRKQPRRRLVDHVSSRDIRTRICTCRNKSAVAEALSFKRKVSMFACKGSTVICQE